MSSIVSDVMMLKKPQKAISKEAVTYDVAVIGGGINGIGIANDAAGRGLSVALFEKDDLAQATSSASSKLIHGGLRYLEYYEFKLVRQALKEREVLLKKAPHIIWPMRFRMPHQPELRPSWMIRTGLWIYDHLAKRVSLPGSTSIKFDENSPLSGNFSHGYEYSDLWADDARLVVLNAIQAHQKGADIYLHTQVTEAKRSGGRWEITVKRNNSQNVYFARALVNASGPWVADLFENTIDQASPHKIRKVKGSHIIVPKLHDQPQSYILQNTDKRVIFVTPYEQEFSLIGTTDADVERSLDDVSISDTEAQYLLKAVNQYFKKQLRKDDIVASYAGVRPLLDDGQSSASAVTRDYKLILSHSTGEAPLLSVFGGKLTTYRRLAEKAVNQLKPFFPDAGPMWTKTAVLPGGDFTSHEQLRNELATEYSWLEPALLQRWVRSYGTLTRELIDKCESMQDLGDHFGADLYLQEVNYLIKHEWASSQEDILFRRSKLYLHLDINGQDKLEAHMRSLPH